MSEGSSFDAYLQEQLQDPEFRERFEAADRALEITFQLAELRRKRGLTQAQVAAIMGTKRQTIARLENPASYGQTFAALRRYAEVLGGELRVTVVPREPLASATPAT
jgi:DNA-binding XRE family transcriptional regulator